MQSSKCKIQNELKFRENNVETFWQNVCTKSLLFVGAISNRPYKISRNFHFFGGNLHLNLLNFLGKSREVFVVSSSKKSLRAFA